MVKNRRSKPPTGRLLKNQRRSQISFAQVLSSANLRAHEQANRRCGKRSKQYVWAADADTEIEEEVESSIWLKRMMRWTLALLLLPICTVTSWTFLLRFSQATVDQDFWRTAEFWYFATGALVMIGWFWSGLFQIFFLYLYVLGHELTHAVFVLLFRGKVTEFHVSVDGGYITTDKSNWLIALSPYFVPFWSVMTAGSYTLMRYAAGLSQKWDLVLYGLLGVTWTFHMAWTLWMIPRDQPDLRENGTFLSLVVIYMANVLVLVGLLCVASDSPLQSAREFAMEWFRLAATWGDAFVRWGNQMIGDFREAGRF